MRQLIIFSIIFFIAFTQESFKGRRFEQLRELLPTPNVYRTGSGAPGHLYWQNRADYKINVELDDEKQQIRGEEWITYFNNSPDALNYLWVQLEQNNRAKDSDTYSSQTNKVNPRMSRAQIMNMESFPDFDGGYKIFHVKDSTGTSLKYTIVKTMMRIDLPQVLNSGQRFKINIKWVYQVLDRMLTGDRGGFEYFEEDKNYIYTITQWFPRMAVYTDYMGWNHKQFLGRGEFALIFGDYEVNITTASDLVIASTGELINATSVLSTKQVERFNQAKKSNRPIKIITLDEAQDNEKSRSKTKKTWIYKAENVRDFAFGASRKFVWDAMGVSIQGSKLPITMAMSYYPKEAYALYEKYSTEVVAHTLKSYSKHTIAYPYPVAISVEASNGMEYPMICFNYGRTEKDGTYSEATKYGMIGVIIHEVGHNFFPMIVNSDERQWTWMDEGLNTFTQYMAELEWDVNYPFRRGPASKIVPYMTMDKSQQDPIMTNSEQIKQFGWNAYAKPATALNILRETVMGRELFDYAYKEYAERWAFKHPEPADFFRTMEDASGMDLDWFWKGWFFTTEHVDISIEQVKWFTINTMNPDIENKLNRVNFVEENKHISQFNEKKADPTSHLDENPHLNDFYNKWDPFEVTDEDREKFKKYLQSLTSEERKIYDSNKNYYELHFKNIGGLVMPVILEFTFIDGSKEIIKLPAEVWRMDEESFSKVFTFKKELKSIRLDPLRETADADEHNNFYPRQIHKNRFELFKMNSNPRGSGNGVNPMQKKKKN